jgi:hypothetical protein
MHVHNKLPIKNISIPNDIVWEKRNVYNHEPFEKYTNPAYANLIQTEVYQRPNPMPEWVDNILKYFDHFDIFEPSISKIPAGKVLPLHRDHFRTFSKIHNITDLSDITRYLVFLQKHTPGQLFQIEDTVYSSWGIGSYLSWQGLHSHAVYNMSNVDRIALQITCVRKAS